MRHPDDRHGAARAERQNVAWARELLRELGYYRAALHGDRDAATRDAIRRFRHDQGLDGGTGELDTETMRHLARAEAQRRELGDFPVPDPTERPV